MSHLGCVNTEEYIIVKDEELYESQSHSHIHIPPFFNHFRPAMRVFSRKRGKEEADDDGGERGAQ